MLRAILVLPLLFMLAGCSREPSAADMEKAVGDMIEQTIASFQQIKGAQGQVAVKGFDGFDGFNKLGCTELEGNRGYSCKFSYTATTLGQSESGEITGRFFQTEQGWVAELGT